MSVEDVLRDTLRAAPEPPETLGAGAASARRRAKAIKRRRYAAVTSAVTCVALVVAGLALVAPPRRASVEPLGPPPAGVYPEWPRRGDAPPSVDDEAVAAYDAYVAAMPGDIAVVRRPRVLYASQRDVVLHTLAELGGERMVVLTRGADGRFAVYADLPAALPDAPAVAVVLDLPKERPGSKCSTERAGGATPAAGRLLVVGAPSTTSFRWRVQPDPDMWCPNDPSITDWADVELGADGAAVVPVRDIMFSVLVEVPDAPEVRLITGPFGPRRYNEVVSAPDASDPPLDWAYRFDDSRATMLHQRLDKSRALADAYFGDDLGPEVHLSLPDGTPVVFGALKDTPEPLVVLFAEGGDRRVRSYLEVAAEPVPSAYAAIVHGHDGAWLVVVGPETLRAAALVDGGERRDVPLQHGVGWLRLTEQPSAEAYVWTPDHAPDGGVEIARGPGQVVTLP